MADPNLDEQLLALNRDEEKKFKKNLEALAQRQRVAGQIKKKTTVKGTVEIKRSLETKVTQHKSASDAENEGHKSASVQENEGNRSASDAENEGHRSASDQQNDERNQPSQTEQA